MRLSELQNKDIININDGKKIGNIIDILIDQDGKMTGFLVEQSHFLKNIFSNHDEYEIKWEQIEKIGEDVILVKISF